MSHPLAADLDHVLEHTRSIWDDVRDERIFITGATGFFGCWLLESFLWANKRLKLNSSVTLLTRSPQAFIAKTPQLALAESVTLLSGDIRTFAFPVGTFSHIVHAASEVSARLNIENPLRILDTIVDGTRHTLDFASQCNAKNFLLTSSGAIYGKQPPHITHLSENYPGAPDPLDPKSAYGQGKRLAEHLCAQYTLASDLQPKIARCFTFIGPYLPLDSHFAVGNFIRNGLNGDPIVIKGDGTALRSYLYGADLAIWLWTILLRGKKLQPYNVGSEHSISIINLAKTIADIFNPAPQISVSRPASDSAYPEQYIPSTQKARDELGLLQWIDLQTALNKTKKWYTQTPTLD